MKATKALENYLFTVQKTILTNPVYFWAIMTVNIFGVLYGFFWYQNQLATRPIHFWLFIPDCPGAVLLFLVWIVLIRLKKPARTFRVLAITALIKYGIWTVGVIGLNWIENGIQYWENVMLFISHWGMLLLGIVFAAKMKISRQALLVTSFWLILNDFIDYYFQVYPALPDESRLFEICLGTFVLSIAIIFWMVNRYLRLG